ncbi:hypothetical protein O181_128847 [Austropuccinia psidii MF-1]|uniref:Uncharacterized protein n=1 Tax=Austropuccinia psidii MF-1 TaxID=1389203 RepID=A0A9Q3QAW7_9BASI|nr:hypothetical protein [Austropuccinia psidii MF-1]
MSSPQLRQWVRNCIWRLFEMSELAVVHYMIKTATTCSLHRTLFPSITQVHLSPSREAVYFVNELVNCVPHPSSSSSLALNKAAKQGVIECNRKKAEMDTTATHKPRLGFLVHDSLEEGKVEIDGVQQEKGTFSNKAEDSKDGWQSDQQERAAKRRGLEESNSNLEDLDKPESPEDEAGTLKKVWQQDAKYADESVAMQETSRR